RLLRPLSQSLHGRLGTRADPYRSGWRRAAVPCRARDPRINLRRCAIEAAALDLGRIARVSAFPWRRMDAGTLPLLRAQDPRFRWMPLPGDSLYRRPRRHRPGLLTRTHARVDRPS